MTVSKVYYYERASIFDRMLILLLGLACIVLVNMRSSCPPCKALDAMNLEKQKKAHVQEGLPDHLIQAAEIEGSGLRKDMVDMKWSEKSEKGEKKKFKKNKEGGGGGGDGHKKKSWEDKNWKESWKEKNKGELKKRKAEKEGKEGGKKEGAADDGDGEIPPDSLWVNKYDVVHIMITRYMQLQPDLVHLGKARNDLFRTFTLPSVVAQTTQEFVWIILTDPDLNAEVLDELVDMIKPYKNILLLGMNNGMNNFRNYGWMQNIKKVFSGDLQMLKDYRVASKHRVLLETRIDADDSIYVEMIDAVQKQAGQSLAARAKEHKYIKSKIKKEYRIFCTEFHLEWGYFNPWEKSSTKGHIFGISHDEFCISAGLTYGYQVGTEKEDLPTFSHHVMSVLVHPCKKTESNRNCTERIDARGYKYIMLRSRTPTSAGMMGVIPTKDVINSETWKNQQDWAWDNVIQKNFAITPESIFQLRNRLKENMVNILTDALKGQCTKAEFTCKDTTKRDLEKLLEQVKENS